MGMGYIGREKLLDKSNNSVYKLVLLASKRALEIAEGQPKLVGASADTKPSTIALMEIQQGKVHSKKVSPKE